MIEFGLDFSIKKKCMLTAASNIQLSVRSGKVKNIKIHRPL